MATITLDRWMKVKPELMARIKNIVMNAENKGLSQRDLYELYEQVITTYKLTHYACRELAGYFKACKDCLIITQFAYRIDGKLYGTIRTDSPSKKGKDIFFPHYSEAGKPIEAISTYPSGIYYKNGKPFF